MRAEELHRAAHRAIAIKAAVESLTQVFATELRGRQITVNAVAPRPLASELFVKG